LRIAGELAGLSADYSLILPGFERYELFELMPE
jgi:hypothetical protein